MTKLKDLKGWEERIEPLNENAIEDCAIACVNAKIAQLGNKEIGLDVEKLARKLFILDHDGSDWTYYSEANKLHYRIKAKALTQAEGLITLEGEE